MTNLLVLSFCLHNNHIAIYGFVLLSLHIWTHTWIHFARSTHVSGNEIGRQYTINEVISLADSAKIYVTFSWKSEEAVVHFMHRAHQWVSTDHRIKRWNNDVIRTSRNSIFFIVFLCLVLTFTPFTCFRVFGNQWADYGDAGFSPVKFQDIQKCPQTRGR